MIDEFEWVDWTVNCTVRDPSPVKEFALCVEPGTNGALGPISDKTKEERGDGGPGQNKNILSSGGVSRVGHPLSTTTPKRIAPRLVKPRGKAWTGGCRLEDEIRVCPELVAARPTKP